jgi:hypothetical protein
MFDGVHASSKSVFAGFTGSVLDWDKQKKGKRKKEKIRNRFIEFGLG